MSIEEAATEAVREPAVDEPAVNEPAVNEPAVDEHGAFAGRVASVFTTRVSLFFLTFLTSILISRLLGPDLKGVYVVVVTLPGMLVVVGMFGLSNSVNYFAGRGHSVQSLIRAAYLFTAVLSILLVAAAWLAIPVLQASILSGVRGTFHAGPSIGLPFDYSYLLRPILVLVPLGVLSSFGVSILYGRQAVRAYNLIQIGLALLTLLCVGAFVWVLGLGVNGAVAGAFVVAPLTTVAVMTVVHRLARRSPGGSPAAVRGLVAYGARVWPYSITSFFNYRADTYILQAVIIGGQAANLLGLYSLAVTMDELVFYIPDSIATLFLPRVAGSTVEDSSRMVARVGRLTTLLTLGVAVCLMPAAYVGVHLVLPAYVGCLPAFFVLLPGVISLSIGKVMTSYVGGRGHPGLVSIATVVSLVLNVAVNLFTIPRFGIVGASLASVISYTAQAGLAVAFASRLSGQSPLALIVPGRAEVSLLIATLTRLARQTRPFRGAGRGSGAG
jgi:O-antigen/teichoic acid export membrane protein